ncbi:MAG: hypothetical protein WCC97_16215 [Candidatus Acidiferrales bacterium]
MKTADKEHQKRWLNKAASRDQRTEGNDNPAQRGGLDGKKKSSRRRSLFSLTPFIELTRSWPDRNMFASCGEAWS